VTSPRVASIDTGATSTTEYASASTRASSVVDVPAASAPIESDIVPAPLLESAAGSVTVTVEVSRSVSVPFMTVIASV